MKRWRVALVWAMVGGLAWAPGASAQAPLGNADGGVNAPPDPNGGSNDAPGAVEGVHFEVSTEAWGGNAFSFRQNLLQSDVRGVAMSNHLVLARRDPQAPRIDLSYRVIAHDENSASVGGLLFGLGRLAGLEPSRILARLARAHLRVQIVDPLPTADRLPRALVVRLLELAEGAVAASGRPGAEALFRRAAETLDIPHARTRGGGGDPLWVPAPLALRTTVDPTLCAAKVPGGVLFCKAAIEKGDAILVWDWYLFAPEPPAGFVTVTAIDGYHVYRQGTVPVRVATLPDPAAQGRRFDYVAGTCYTVRAYFGFLESADSNLVCLDPPQDRTETIVLPGLGHVTDPRTRTDVATWACFPVTCGPMTLGTGTIPPPAGGLVAGYSWTYDNGTRPCNCWQGVDHYYWSAVTFDLASIPDLGARLISAELKYDADVPGCADVVGLTAVSDGHLGSIAVYHDVSTDGTAFAATAVTLGATDMVNDVLGGAAPPFFGFRSAQQGSGDGSIQKDNGGCTAMLTDLRLALRVLKKP